MNVKKFIGINQGLLVLLFCVISSAGYGWNTVNGIPICAATAYQYTPLTISDGSGGAIITWSDRRNTLTVSTASTDIYAQRINSSGSTLWTVNGVAISTVLRDQINPSITDDNAGGAIITWQDYRGTATDIYAQRINSSGSTLWTTNGIPICTATSFQTYPKAVGDGSGGAVITWLDYRNGEDIYAQRVNSSGSTLWTLDGVAICTEINFQYYPAITSDSSGGAIITWYDLRNGNNDIYAQRVNSQGSTVWTTNGIAICTAAHEQYYPQIISDGSGGGIIVWYDFRDNVNTHIYAQRVNSAGSTMWTFNGLAVCTVAGEQDTPLAVSDGAGGAILTWEDTRLGNYHVYVQRVSAGGTNLWTANGVALCTATYYQVAPVIVSDGTGGAVVTWQDFRSTTLSNIYAQHVDSTGNVLWTNNGVALSTSTGFGQSSPTIADNGFGGAIVAFMDYRKPADVDIYAQSISNAGLVPVNDWFNYVQEMTLPKRR